MFPYSQLPDSEALLYITLSYQVSTIFSLVFIPIKLIEYLMTGAQVIMVINVQPLLQSLISGYFVSLDICILTEAGGEMLHVFFN